MKLTDYSPFKMNSVLMLNKQSLSSKNIKLKKLNPDLPSVKYLFKKKRESIPKLRLYNKTDTNSITGQQLFKLTQSSMNENSNSTALDTFNEPSSALSYRKIDMYNNKARLIKKKILKRIFSIKIDSTFDDDSGKDHYFLPLKIKKRKIRAKRKFYYQVRIKWNDWFK